MTFPIDLRSLYYFVRVAEFENVTRAAAHLNIAQPALTRHMQRLEEEFGVPLFARVNKGVLLTDAGQQLYQKAQRVLRDAELLRDEMRTLGGEPSGEVMLGILTSTSRVLIPPIAMLVRRTLPKIR